MGFDLLFYLVVDLGNAALFLAAWLRPMALSRDSVVALPVTLFVEFILLHAHGFLGVLQHSALAMLLLLMFYAAFMLVLARSVRAWWPLIALAALGASKAYALYSGADAGLSVRWLLATLSFIGAISLCAILPLPRFGLDRQAQRRLRFDRIGSGRLLEQPHRAMAAGVLYFGVLAGFDCWLLLGSG